MIYPNHSRRVSCRASWTLPLTLILVLCLSAGTAFAQPTVNGWFYGDGDDALYSPYAVSEYGSVLYSY
ncbi:MAG TPA: hypothetical protein VNB06_23860, partial [Thermoanaerobaculia bacterium]|nr:hypothetical protein [Thermoanaerobaculia bacterium]